MNGNEAQRRLPQYQCHKKVFALKISGVVIDSAADCYRMSFADEGYSPIGVDTAWFKKHQPQAGGYYVVYEDGYKSFSPAKAFEGGYTRI